MVTLDQIWYKVVVDNKDYVFTYADRCSLEEARRYKAFAVQRAQELDRCPIEMAEDTHIIEVKTTETVVE